MMNALKSASDGEYLIVGHLAHNDAEIQNLGHPGYPGTSVAHNLNWERLAYVDPRMLKFVKENGVVPIRYDETEAAREQVKTFRSPTNLQFVVIFPGKSFFGKDQQTKVYWTFYG